MNVAFQPIMSLATGETIAHEALARCKLDAFRSPEVLFNEASNERACGRLGRIIRNVLFEQCAGMPVFINLHPQELSQRWLVQPTDPLYLHDAKLYLEITETAAFEHFDLCLSVLTEVRARCGARLVVDDFGAGHSTMERVLALRPDFVKLDMSLIRSIDQDPAKQAEVRRISDRCRDICSHVVAEGIETHEEMEAVRDLAVGYGQGYFLGRPSLDPTPGTCPTQ